MQFRQMRISNAAVSPNRTSVQNSKIGKQSVMLQNYNSKNVGNEVKDHHQVQFRIKRQNRSNFSFNLNASSVSEGKIVNLGSSNERVSNKITNDIKFSINQKMKKNNTPTRTTCFYSRQESFVGVDPNRISKYRNPRGVTGRETEKWDKSLQRYMQAKTKMSVFFNETKKNSGEFNEIQLDRNNIILQNRKMLELKSLSPQYRRSKNQNQFVSYLIPKMTKEGRVIKNQMIKSVANNGNVKRCDALLVNFVSTYFRRKFYKKNKKLDSLRRMKTDDPQLSEMVALQGSTIDDQIINTNMLDNPDKKYTERKQIIVKDQNLQFS